MPITGFQMQEEIKSDLNNAFPRAENIEKGGNNEIFKSHDDNDFISNFTDINELPGICEEKELFEESEKSENNSSKKYEISELKSNPFIEICDKTEEDFEKLHLKKTATSKNKLKSEMDNTQMNDKSVVDTKISKKSFELESAAVQTLQNNETFEYPEKSQTNNSEAMKKFKETESFTQFESKDEKTADNLPKSQNHEIQPFENLDSLLEFDDLDSLAELDRKREDKIKSNEEESIKSESEIKYKIENQNKSGILSSQNLNNDDIDFSLEIETLAADMNIEDEDFFW